MDMPKEDPIKKVFDSYHEGDDVITGVGIWRPEEGRAVAYILVDYTQMSEEHRAFYTKSMIQMWEDLQRGILLDFLDERSLRVSSVVRFVAQAQAAPDSDMHVLNAPALYVECYSDPASVSRFRQELESLNLWLLHIKTLDASYLMTMSYPDGTVVSRQQKKPLDISFIPLR